MINHLKSELARLKSRVFQEASLKLSSRANQVCLGTLNKTLYTMNFVCII